MKLIFFLSMFSTAFNSSLQEAYDNASSNENYDKYVMLEPNSTYTGGLGIYEGDVYINCQGSTINLEGGNGILSILFIICLMLIGIIERLISSSSTTFFIRIAVK